MFVAWQRDGDNKTLRNYCTRSRNSPTQNALFPLRSCHWEREFKDFFNRITPTSHCQLKMWLLENSAMVKIKTYISFRNNIQSGEREGLLKPVNWNFTHSVHSIISRSVPSTPDISKFCFPSDINLAGEPKPHRSKTVKRSAGDMYRCVFVSIIQQVRKRIVKHWYIRYI